jgi:DNA-dependent RNA polymerase auxiliary subunit epsilon
MTKKKTRKPRKDLTDRLYAVVAEYLEKNGWKAIVIGGTCIKQEITDRKYNYDFVVRFTGGKVK